ncbi:MAG: hypothetical protein LBS44_01300 [Deltaproteobacteria bacterium]|jgi:uracil-DNA glycosylase family 4|nr:hypothetical protein [Deltaproteobacteria bacterium]
MTVDYQIQRFLSDFYSAIEYMEDLGFKDLLPKLPPKTVFPKLGTQSGLNSQANVPNFGGFQSGQNDYATTGYQKGRSNNFRDNESGLKGPGYNEAQLNDGRYGAPKEKSSGTRSTFQRVNDLPNQPVRQKANQYRQQFSPYQYPDNSTSNWAPKSGLKRQRPGDILAEYDQSSKPGETRLPGSTSAGSQSTRSGHSQDDYYYPSEKSGRSSGSYSPGSYSPGPEESYLRLCKEPQKISTVDTAWIEAVNSLDDLNKALSSCRNCHLHQTRKAVIPGRGPKGAPIFFVFDTPGLEANDGLRIPYGPEAELFDNIITKGLKMSPDNIYVTAISKCAVPDPTNYPETFPMKACLHLLYREIDLVGPRVVIALGARPSQILTGLDIKNFLTLKQQQMIITKTKKIPLKMTFDLPSIMENVDIKKEFWNDLKKVLSFLNT